MKTRPLLLSFVVLALCGCAMQRAKDSEAAQARMIGLDREQIFACMGLPEKKGSQGETEIWLYKSGNERTTKNKTRTGVSGSSLDASLFDALSTSLTMEDEVKEKRYCIIQVVFKDNAVRAVNYSGPTGGFLTQDEQCSYAVRNCNKN